MARSSSPERQRQRRMSKESHERKEYRTTVTIFEQVDGERTFEFEPALPDGMISDVTENFFKKNIKVGGGEVRLSGKKNVISFTIPKSVDDITLGAFFERLERDGFSFRRNPLESELTQRQSSTKFGVTSAMGESETAAQNGPTGPEVQVGNDEMLNDQSAQDVAKVAQQTLGRVTELTGKYKRAEAVNRELDAENRDLSFEVRRKEAEIEYLRKNSGTAVDLDAFHKKLNARTIKELEAQIAELQQQLDNKNATPSVAPGSPAGGPGTETKMEVPDNEKLFQEALGKKQAPSVELTRKILARKQKLTVKENQTLIISKERYAVEADIVVEAGGSLVIAEGTQLFFGENGGIVCDGTITAKGNAKEKIYFGGLHPDKTWKNISLQGKSKKMLQHCVVEGGRGRAYHIDDESRTAYLLDRDQEDDQPLNEKKKSRSGGGIACINECDNAELKNVEVRNCRSNGSGGGIFVYQSSARMDSVYCHKNEAATGGGIYLNGGNSTVNKSRVEGNKVFGNGGGMYVANGNQAITDSKVEKNEAKQSGGGMFLQTSAHHTARIQNVDLSQNIAEKAQGGGLFISVDYDQKTGEQFAPVLEGLNITANRAKEGGGCFAYHNIPRKSYDFMHHTFNLNTKKLDGNTPDNFKQIFRSA